MPASLIGMYEVIRYVQFYFCIEPNELCFASLVEHNSANPLNKHDMYETRTKNTTRRTRLNLGLTRNVDVNVRDGANI
jgi:hypothetical protein